MRLLLVRLSPATLRWQAPKGVARPKSGLLPQWLPVPLLSFWAARLACALLPLAMRWPTCFGLVCDPIGGLVEAPCQKRNASAAVNALSAAQMALAGIEGLIPFDEVVDAMLKVGRSLPYELRETALGGMAACPSCAKFCR